MYKHYHMSIKNPPDNPATLLVEFIGKDIKEAREYVETKHPGCRVVYEKTCDDTYVIYSKCENDSQPDTPYSGFWKHEFGWTHISEATAFTEEEMAQYKQADKTPISRDNDVIWLKVSKIK